VSRLSLNLSLFDSILFIIVVQGNNNLFLIQIMFLVQILIKICFVVPTNWVKVRIFSPSNPVLSPLQLIHTDIWTSPVLLVSGYKCYIVFVDDFYPLHTKSEAYDAFLKFKLLIENQFSTTIQELQSDGGGKYIFLNF
jgi:hypothetical protein